MREIRTSGSMSGEEETDRGCDSARGASESEPFAAGADKPERHRASRRLYLSALGEHREGHAAVR